jgi:transposase
MPKGYRPYLPDQDLLLPPSLRDWLPEDHLVYFVSDVVDQLDLRAIHAWYVEEKRGQPPYDPILMTKNRRAFFAQPLRPPDSKLSWARVC